MKKRDNKSQSEIITTVLIILLVLAAVVIVWQVVKTTVESGTKNIESTVACLDAMDVLEIDEGGSCYEDIGGGIIGVNVKVNRGLEDVNIDSFVIVVTSEGNSENFEVKEGDSPSNIEMYNDPISNLETPQPGESKTYSIETTFTGDIDSLEIAPIINDKLCNPSEKVKINACT